jgi:hypothetical protein
MADRGHPLKFKDAEELSAKIDDYFKHREEMKKPPTITGLALWLDCNIKTLQRYNDCEDETEEKYALSLPIKKAYAKCFDYVYEGILTSKFPTGYIFAGKNFGMSDSVKVDQTNTSKVIIVDMIGNIDD